MNIERVNFNQSDQITAYFTSFALRSVPTNKGISSMNEMDILLFKTANLILKNNSFCIFTVVCLCMDMAVHLRIVL